MGILTLSGLSLVGASGYGLVRQIGRERRTTKRILKEVFEIAGVQTELEDVIQEARIRKMHRRKYGFDVVIQLPKGYPVDKFRKQLPTIEQATASKIRMTYLRGRDVQLDLGTIPLDPMMKYRRSLIRKGRPTVPYYTSFGVKHLDFWDETCCHIIAAGATRMGKSVLLRLLFTNIMLAMDGCAQFFYVNNKLEDWYPMQGVPQIPPPAETIVEASELLTKVLEEMQRRREKLRLTRDSVNIRQYREKHPEDPVPPMFVVIDEYGRFAEDEDFQTVVTEIAETAGYLDVHLVIATQRPDASTVLKPRIRANILTRVCFQTADEKNSEIVVHSPAAAHLDQIRGRAVVLDGMPELGHIPYVSEEMTMDLLAPYRKEEDASAERQGPTDTEPAQTLPGFVTGPVRSASVPGSATPLGDYQPDHETPRPGRTHHHRTAPPRRVLPIHAEPGHDSHGVDEDSTLSGYR